MNAILCTGPCPTTTTTTTPPPTQLRMLFTDIYNIIDYPNDLNEWNNFFQLPSYGNPFTSLTLIGNEIFLFGGSNITLRDGLFNNEDILEIEDVTSNVIIDTIEKIFVSATALTTVILPAVLTISSGSFDSCFSLIILNISSCTNLGPTVGNDNVFQYIAGNTITLTVPLALTTCNSGSFDGDIQYLIDNNTVTIITV
jgi:hypothetical protein